MTNILVTGLVILSTVLSSNDAFAALRLSASDSSIKSKKLGLIYPVASKRSFVGSFWGASRDGGKRSHEGVDIFARKGTPVVAMSDGVVVSVGKGGRGGKTVWLRSFGHSWSEYYAHLDQQKVKVGQFVKKGQVIGTVGNTGNARYTPSHLHFGIYTTDGAINPFPYVKRSSRLSLPPARRQIASGPLVKGSALRRRS